MGQLRCSAMSQESSNSRMISVPHLVQVLPPGASKGAGVAQLMQLVKVPPENVMALGDGENDLEMMQVSMLLQCLIEKRHLHSSNEQS